MRRHWLWAAAAVSLTVWLALWMPAENAQTATNAPVRLAIIGDYGLAGTPEAAVATQISTWNVDYLATAGDNNYQDGAASTIDANIGQFYSSYIHPYTGGYGAGAQAPNRFYPCLGNHDWVASGAQPYLDYFTLPTSTPGNERYYSVVLGPLHLFCIDSDPSEPDGNVVGSTQAIWLQNALAASTARWQLVYMHHPPFSSGIQLGMHGSNPELQWPYADWGADVVVAGHDHFYERIERDGIPYFVVGLSGAPIHNSFASPIPGSQVRYTDAHGALLAIANEFVMTFQFINRFGAVIDTRMLSPFQIFLPSVRR